MTTSRSRSIGIALGAVAVLLTSLSASCDSNEKAGYVLDEAMAAKRLPPSLPAAGEDYFKDMDGGIALTPGEVKGRNTWIVWTGGNDRFWDHISPTSFGALDFLKTLSSHPVLRYKRENRWREIGLVNEPCFSQAKGPDPKHFGLWLDQRDPNCPPDPFADDKKYPGVAFGARGKNMPVGSYYGEPTGIVGFRLFPNPAFDADAASKWNAERYYTDSSYYLSKDLVRPYRVGMSCGFCHVGPNPIKPPVDPNNPKWENLSSNVGAQYFWVDRIFDWRGVDDAGSFIYQLFHTSRPGSLDTSLVSTDNINNPRTMNAVYGLVPRLGLAKRWGKETLKGGSADNKQFNDYVPPLPAAFNDYFDKATNTVWTPRVLKDGSDSVGALGALNRVYINIGLFSEEWLLHFRPLIGGQQISPIPIATARKNSSYWGATETQTPDMALFFLKSTDPHYLKDAPGGAAFLTEDRPTVTHGKEVFAERCARCHSSKGPAPPPPLDLASCNGPNHMNCWNQYWAWTKTDGFKSAMKATVLADDFLTGNYLSTELRVPVTLLETGACSPLATNAIRNNIWDNFSSDSYKALPSVGTITVRHPVTGEPKKYEMPGGGRGFTRPASLISLWSTAPYLQNNSVGRFEWEPSVAARMRSFQDSIESMLWPEKRDRDDIFDGDAAKPNARELRRSAGHIDRTTSRSYLRVPVGFVPDHLRGALGLATRLFPFLFSGGDIRIGPIPEGTPVNLIANLNIRSDDPDPLKRVAHDRLVLDFVLKAQKDLPKVENASDFEARMIFRQNLVEPMLALSKCPDFVVNRGHYFGTDYLADEEREPGLSDTDKRALIAFLKMF